jgi:hypothetical protein
MHVTVEQPALLDALRQAFARGDGPQGDSLLLAALETDLPWDRVARTVAEGVALRYAATTSQQVPPATGRPAGRAERGSRTRLGRARLTDRGLPGAAGR